MKMSSKRFSTYLIASFSLFLAGLEYAVVIPTLNPFLMSINAEPYFVGLTLSAMCLTALLSSPIYGRIADITKKTKALVIISNVFEIGGNIMYLLSTDPYMIVGSRLVIGLGAGSISAIISMITRTCTATERTTFLSRTFASRQTGLLLGAACNFFLRKFNFYIGTCHIDQYTAPGFFMAALWCIQTILMLLFYHDLKYIKLDVVNNDSNEKKSDSTLVTEKSKLSDDESVPPIQIQQNTSYFNTIKLLGKDLLWEGTVLLLAISFAIMFVQLGVEGITTPLAYRLFRWKSFENSIYYSGFGLIFVICLVLLSPLSKKVSDLNLLLFGLLCLSSTNLMFLVFVIYAFEEPSGTTWVLSLFILYGFILTLGIAFGWIPLVSLYSKMTTQKNQGFNQGIRLVCMGVGQILGPIWASSLLNNLVVMTSVNFGLLFFLLFLFLSSYSHLKSRETRANAKDEMDEKAPLLSEAATNCDA